MLRTIAVCVAVGACAGAASAEPASAEPAPPKLAALAAGDDARGAILVGPEGQIYAPDGHGAWARTQAGGIAGTVVLATRAGADVIAGVTGAPPFRFDGRAWESIYLAMHAKAVVARGRRAVAAVGRQVFALDHAGAPQRLPDAPATVLALGASPAGVAVLTERGVARLDGKSWRAVERAPRVVALASDRWAITADGAYDLVANTAVDLRGAVAVAADGDALVAATPTELLTVRGGKVTRAPLPATGAPVGVAVDRDHAVVALADGRVFVRDHDAWSTTEVHDALPAPRPGPGPASSP
jgi:hypothetical protein